MSMARLKQNLPRAISRRRLLGYGLAGMAGAAAGLWVWPALKGVMDASFLSSPARYAGPLREYILGRYIFSVPEELTEMQMSIRVYPPVPENVTESYKTKSFEIKEFPWKTRDQQREFEAAWRHLREEGKDSFDAREYGAEGYAENLDAGKLFGRPAVCIAYNQRHLPAPIKTFVSLPQGIVCFEESRRYYKTTRGTEIETPALKIFKTYSWGKSRGDRPDTFYTRLGKLNGYATKDETANVWFANRAKRYELSYSTDVPLPMPPGLQKLLQEAAAQGIPKARPPRGFSATNLLTRPRTLSDMQFMEYIDKFITPNSEEYELRFSLYSPEYKGTLERPYVELEFDTPWDERYNALPLWNAVLAGFQSVPYALGGRR
jgi:hypothetical protein